MSALAKNPPTFYANKRIGHGRTAQLLIRFRCVVRGHDFGRFNEGVRVCQNRCGGCTTRGDGRCTECGIWAGQMQDGWFGDLTGWLLGKGFLLCPQCSVEQEQKPPDVGELAMQREVGRFLFGEQEQKP